MNEISLEASIFFRILNPYSAQSVGLVNRQMPSLYAEVPEFVPERPNKMFLKPESHSPTVEKTSYDDPFGFGRPVPRKPVPYYQVYTKHFFTTESKNFQIARVFAEYFANSNASPADSEPHGMACPILASNDGPTHPDDDSPLSQCPPVDVSRATTFLSDADAQTRLRSGASQNAVQYDSPQSPDAGSDIRKTREAESGLSAAQKNPRSGFQQSDPADQECNEGETQPAEEHEAKESTFFELRTVGDGRCLPCENGTRVESGHDGEHVSDRPEVRVQNWREQVSFDVGNKIRQQR